MSIKKINSISQEQISAFWSKVNKNGDIPQHKSDIGNCWIWTASFTRGKYGQFHLDGRPYLAHRVSYFIANNEIQSLPVLHICDNPSCVRPSHLSIGTLSDNTQDMLKKGRCNPPHGERSGSAKFNWEQVQDIRAMNKAGIKTRLICEKYQRGRAIINLIISGKIWKQKS